jgi:hypothetical protein
MAGWHATSAQTSSSIPGVRYVLSRLIPPSGRATRLFKHLRQLLALLLGRPLSGDTMLVCPVIRICVPRREHLVVVAGNLGHWDRRCPAHAPATLADLIWSFHLTTRLMTCVGQQPLYNENPIAGQSVRRSVHAAGCIRWAGCRADASGVRPMCSY